VAVADAIVAFVLEEVVRVTVVAPELVVVFEMVSVKVKFEGIAHSLGWGM
jgi:hypothetical protein